MPYILPSTLTQQNAVAVELDGLCDLAQLQTVDCTALRDFDSSALAVLIAWQKKITAGSARANLSKSTAEIVRIGSGLRRC